MKDTPILMTGTMVRAYFAGLKGQTRRIGKCQMAGATQLGVEYCEHATRGTIALATSAAFPGRGSARWALCDCPYGIAGDRLWVRETWALEPTEVEFEKWAVYRADNEARRVGLGENETACNLAALGFDPRVHQATVSRWQPSIFMPRWASRIALEVLSVRVERLQDISEEDAWAEGCKRGERTDNGGWFPAEEPHKSGKGLVGWDCARDWYRDLWNEINLEPKAIYGRDAAGKKVISSYQSFPWCGEDFDERYPGAREKKVFRGKPLVVIANPWVWVIEFPKFQGVGTPARRDIGGPSLRNAQDDSVGGRI